jgi:uncharacterized protein (TIGR03435 family)
MSFAGTLAELANALNRSVDLPVIDRTGLAGRYQFFLQYVPESARLNGASGPSIFQALSDYGLELKQSRAPIDILVVEHIEKPTEN